MNKQRASCYRMHELSTGTASLYEFERECRHDGNKLRPCEVFRYGRQTSERLLMLRHAKPLDRLPATNFSGELLVEQAEKERSLLKPHIPQSVLLHTTLRSDAFNSLIPISKQRLCRPLRLIDSQRVHGVLNLFGVHPFLQASVIYSS